MGPQSRMSPLTAFFLGLFGVGAVTIASLAGIVLYGLRVIDKRSDAVFGIVQNTVENLPQLVEELPKAVGDLLRDRRAFEYAPNVDVAARFLFDEKRERVRPTLTITNKGPEVISLLAVRVAALNAQNDAVAEWTETVATPLGISDDWRGPLAPGATRHVLLHGDWLFGRGDATALKPSIEVSELRIWTPTTFAQEPG